MMCYYLNVHFQGQRVKLRLSSFHLVISSTVSSGFLSIACDLRYTGRTVQTFRRELFPSSRTTEGLVVTYLSAYFGNVSSLNRFKVEDEVSMFLRKVDKTANCLQVENYKNDNKG